MIELSRRFFHLLPQEVKEIGIDISGHRSKSVDEFAAQRFAHEAAPALTSFADHHGDRVVGTDRNPRAFEWDV